MPSLRLYVSAVRCFIADRYHARWLVVALCAALLAACSPLGDVPPAPTDAATPAGDAVATQVAIARAVAATLTAAVPVLPSPTAAQEATPAPTDAVAPTNAPAPTDEPTPEPAPTVAPTNDPGRPIPIAYAPNGSSNNVSGSILMPDNARATCCDGGLQSVVVTTPLWFSVLAYVPGPNGEKQDGAGIKDVRITISGTSTSGESVTMHQQTEHQAPYCVFGNDTPDCTVWDFVANGNKWPGGEPVQYGENYSVEIAITGEDSQNSANWFFTCTIEAPQ